jgi:hypothetical protein
MYFDGLKIGADKEIGAYDNFETGSGSKLNVNPF